MHMTRRASRERVLVLGDYRQTVTVVRSLSRAGFGVVLGTPDSASPTARSRHVDDVWLYPAHRERFARSVELYLRKARPAFVFAVGESQLRMLLHVLPRLERLSTWANPSVPAIRSCFDKRTMYALAARLGIPTQPWLGYAQFDAWKAWALQTGFPVVAKLKDSSHQLHDKKALILGDADELDAFMNLVPVDADREGLVVQKYAPGVRHNCHVAAASGKLIAYFEQSVLRTDDLDGTGIGTAGVSVAPNPVLRGHCERLLGALAYTGIGCVQFLVDRASGAVTFLEVNPRMDSTAALPVRLGYDYPRLAIELARYRRRIESGLPALPPACAAHGYPVGKAYHWLLGDLDAWIVAARDGRRSPAELARWAGSMAWLALSSHHLTFDWRDPSPTLAMFHRQFGAKLRRRLLAPLPARSAPR